MEKYVLKYPNGRYVAVDRSTGGYPYESDDFHKATIWYDKEGARHYATMFSGDTMELHLIKEITIITEKI